MLKSSYPQETYNLTRMSGMILSKIHKPDCVMDYPGFQFWLWHQLAE